MFECFMQIKCKCVCDYQIRKIGKNSPQNKTKKISNLTTEKIAFGGKSNQKEYLVEKKPRAKQNDHFAGGWRERGSNEFGKPVQLTSDVEGTSSTEFTESGRVFRNSFGLTILTGT